MPHNAAPPADSPPVDNAVAAEKKAYPSFFGQDEPGKAQASDSAADSKPAAGQAEESPKAEKPADSPKEEKPAPQGFFGQPESKTNGAAASTPAPAEKSAALAQKLASKKGASADSISDEDFKTLTIKDLKIQLKARGLPVSGLKAELIIRLIGESDKAAAE